MQEILSSPYTCILVSAITGAVIGYFAARLSLSTGQPVLPTCSDDYPLAKSKIISPMRAKDMYDEYTRKRVVLIQGQEDDGFEPTRFGSMDFEVLKDYVNYLQCIDFKMKNAGLSGINSVRTYFANYPAQFRNGDAIPSIRSGGRDHSYEGRNTYFMLPTMIEDGEEKGFKYNGNLSAPEFNTIQDFMTSSTESGRLSEVGSLIMNEVGLTPPPPGENGDFAG